MGSHFNNKVKYTNWKVHFIFKKDLHNICPPPPQQKQTPWLVIEQFGSAELRPNFLTKNGRKFGSASFWWCTSSVYHYLWVIGKWSAITELCQNHKFLDKNCKNSKIIPQFLWFFLKNIFFSFIILPSRPEKLKKSNQENFFKWKYYKKDLIMSSYLSLTHL